MGERAEPVQWVLARHRQNSGERQLPNDEELTGRAAYAASRAVGSPQRRRVNRRRSVMFSFFIYL